MAKRSIGPWFREGRGWFVTHRGEQIKLAESDATEAEARDLWSAWVARGRRGRAVTASARSDEITAKEVADRYLVWVDAERSEATASLAKRYLLPWAESLPADLLAAGGNREEQHRVKSYDVDQWIRGRYPKPGAARIARQIIKAAWNWALSDGVELIAWNPLAGLKVGKSGRREIVLDSKQWNKARAAAGPALGAVMDAAIITGMRPQELRGIEAKHINRKSRALQFVGKGGRDRVVYLNDAAWALIQAAAKKYPNGALFRNSGGEPYTKDCLVRSFRRVQKKAKIKGLCAYVLRHTFATDAIVNGVDPITVAELLGHANAEMVMKVYTKIAQKKEHMREAAERAVKRKA